MSENSVEFLLEKTGDFGRFQLFTLISVIIPELPAGTLGMLPVFVGGVPNEWSCAWTSQSGDVSIDRITTKEVCGCNGTLYGGHTSIVSEWNLVCDYAWVSDLITSIFMAGMLAGGLLGSQLADWFGRKKTLYVNVLLMFVMAASSSLASSPFLYAGARFVIGFSMASYLVVGAIYPMEFFTPKWRSLSGTLGPWGEGVMLLSLIAFYFPEWRTLSWVTALPMAITLLSFPFVPESPRWLLEKGKAEEAKLVFDQIARWNGCPKVSGELVDKLANKMSLRKAEVKESSNGYAQLICNSKYRKKILRFMVVWFAYSAVYYGISFNTKNLSGNIYLNMVYMGLIDAVAFPLAVPVINWIGRRKAMIMYAITAAIPMITIVLMELEILIPRRTQLLVILSLVGKFCIAGGWSGIKCFTGESFPTQIRSSAIGISTVSAAIGGIVAPMIVFLGTMNPSMPYFVFAAFVVACALVTFFLEETRGKPIQEGHEDVVTSDEKSP